MNLQELLSKTDFLTSIAQYVGLETMTYFTSISKSSGRVLDRAENVDGALSSAIRSMVCTDVFSQAIERVENIARREYRRGARRIRDTFHGNGRNWLALPTGPAYRLQVGIENPLLCSELTLRMLLIGYHGAHSVVNLGSDTCIGGGFGGTSWRTDGWGIARRAKVFAFAVKTCSSRNPSSPKQGSNWILKLKCCCRNG